LLWFSWKRKFNLLTITIVVAVLAFVLNIMGGVGMKQDIVATFYSPQTRFWELLSGSLLAWVRLYKMDVFVNTKSKIEVWLSRLVCSEKRENDGKTLSSVLSFVGLFLLLYGFWRINKALSFPGKWALVPVIGAVLIITAGSKAWVNRTILSNKFAVWFGLISFPLYLWHWPLLSFARIVESEVPSLNIRIAAVILSTALAWLTYKLVERPFRLGKYSNVKVTILVTLMTVLGCVGYHTYVEDGYQFRNSIKAFVNNKNEIIRTPAIDDECLKYTGIKKPLFPYCRFTNVNSDETVAVIGDSHAHVAYPGIAEYLGNKGVNTVLLANSGCPPFIGSYIATNQMEKEACRDRIEQLLDAVIKKKDIKRVFVFTRGPFYNTGTEPLTGNKDLTGGNVIPITDFTNSAQLSFNRLSKTGKLVFYVTENPELIYSAVSCISRPFKSIIRDCSVEKKLVLERQANYLSAFSNLKNVTIINSLSAFCPQEVCLVFDDEGSLLYADDDHLSVAGSKFLVQKLLNQYLN
jgi:hypothetical protein